MAKSTEATAVERHPQLTTQTTPLTAANDQEVVRPGEPARSTVVATASPPPRRALDRGTRYGPRRVRRPDLITQRKPVNLYSLRFPTPAGKSR